MFGTRNDSDRRAQPPGLLAACLELVLSLAVVTAFGKLARLNVPTVGFLFLVAVLFVASRQALWLATTAAVGATLCYNFFFFSPTGTFTVADPENWIALIAFLATSLLANRLLVRERLQAAEARASRQEVQLLYELSLDLLRSRGGRQGLAAAAERALQAIGATSFAVRAPAAVRSSRSRVSSRSRSNENHSGTNVPASPHCAKATSSRRLCSRRSRTI